MDSLRFRDRQEAGRRLAQLLKKYRGQNVVVYSLPRGGVVLGRVVADFLKAPHDLVIPRKIGHPHNPEYAIGAVTETSEPVLNQAEASSLSSDWLKDAIKVQRLEAKRRRKLYLKDRMPIELKNKTAIIIDDGVATGLTMLAAIKDLKAQKPKKIIVAVPVIPNDTAEVLKEAADEVVALEIPEFFAGAVGAYYDHFDQVEDEEVIALLKQTKL